MRAYSSTLVLCIMIFAWRGTAFAGTPCALNPIDPSVTICAPAASSSVPSPVRITAGTTSSLPTTAIKIYVDDVEQYKIVNSNVLDTQLTLKSGTHRIVLVAWNSSGAVFRSSESITVTSSDSGVGTGGSTSCTASGSDPSVTICSPLAGSTLQSPVRVSAAALSSLSVRAMKVYVDDVEAFKVLNTSTLDTQLALSNAPHKIAVVGWNSSGVAFSKTVNITVTSPPTPLCPLDTSDPSITICTPGDQTSVSSPVHILAGATSSAPTTVMQIYVDKMLVYKQSSTNRLETDVPMAPGNHSLTVQGWNSAGVSFNKTVYVSIPNPLAALPCPLDTAKPSVTICAPNNGDTVTAPFHILAGANSDATVYAMKVYVDGAVKYAARNSQLDAYLPLTPGAHNIAVVAWDSAGASFSKAFQVTMSSSASSQDIFKLKHVIFMLQENRSFDNYFGRMGQYRLDHGLDNNVEGLPLEKQITDAGGDLVSPYHFQTVCHENVMPNWNPTHMAVNNGAMDQFMVAAAKFVPSTIDPHGTRAMGYYDWNDLPFYYELGMQYAISDRFFASLPGPTIPNRMFMFAATSFGHVNPDVAPSTKWQQPTIFDALTQAGVSWRYYYQDNSVYLSEWSTWTRDSSKVQPIAKYYTDLQNEATLPSVIFIERAAASELDEHPTSNIQLGAANTAKLINAFVQSPSYTTSAFILTFDEPGGMYDHVAPVPVSAPDATAPMLKSADQPGDFSVSGLRVPFILVSPFVKPHYVSHTPLDHSAILRFIEKRFGVSPLTLRDANAGDLSEFFDFSAPGVALPPFLPSQPTNAACDHNLEKAPGH